VAAWAELIKAIAGLLWPVFAFFFLWLFKKEISLILRRLAQIRKGKLLGQEIELEERLDELKQSTDQAQEETAKAIPPALDPIGQASPAEQFETNLLRDPTTLPKIKLMLLGPEIERRLRRLLAVTGWHQNIRVPPLIRAINQLQAQGTLPEHVTGSLKLFLDVRNRILHGHDASDEDTLRAIDSGLGVLKAIDAVPTEINVVHHPGVDLYSDSNCEQKVPDAKGVILETTSPGGTTKSFRIFPTTRTHFKKGKGVAREWGFDRTWGRTWYRDPDSGQIKFAWDSAAEFVGRDLDEV
jgi:hypothetical protein